MRHFGERDDAVAIQIVQVKCSASALGEAKEKKGADLHWRERNAVLRADTGALVDRGTESGARYAAAYR